MVVVVVAGLAVCARVGLRHCVVVGVGRGVVSVRSLLVVVRLVHRFGGGVVRLGGGVVGLGGAVVGLHEVERLHEEGLLQTLVVLAVLVVLLCMAGIGLRALVMLRRVGVVLRGHGVRAVVAAGCGCGHLVGVQGHAVRRILLRLLKLARNTHKLKYLCN